MALKKCKACGKEISKKAKQCPNCGEPQGPKHYSLGKLIIALLLAWFLYVVFSASFSNSPSQQAQTKASDSAYNQSITKATTSNNLSNADLAWHAKNTYGWDCSEVIARGEMVENKYFIITCANDTQLRVYPRAGQHPKITNIQGTYK